MKQVHPEISLVQRQAQPVRAEKLRQQGVSAILAHLFSARGVDDISEVRAGTDALLPVESLMNARAMGALLADCVQDGTRVLIVSDYDCDGATACSVLIKAFQGARMNFGYLVPDRFKHGYGLTPSIVDEAAALQPRPRYIVTVDNGISSHAGIERARQYGIEVLVTDHHLCPKELPGARLIVNPQQAGDSFASKSIAGCGVAWYVARALYDEMKQRKLDVTFRPEDLLPYVALGTVADVVTLDMNNRIMVREGLERIRRGECSHGIQQLAAIAQKPLEDLSCQDIGFGLAPRINAAGRLAHMSAGIECLTTRELERAFHLADVLHQTNEERKGLQKQIAREAEDLSRQQRAQGTTDSCVVVFEPDWHEGVVGIVAGRMKDDYHLPAFVLTTDHEGMIKGSGRSVPGFHLKHALDRINIEEPGVLVRFGGHAAAAGVTIHAERLDDFRTAFSRICKEELTEEMLTPKLEHDGVLPEFAYNEQAIHEINREIWGQGFPPPVFVDAFEVTNSRTMGSDGSHLKVSVQKSQYAYDLVAFGEGARRELLPKVLEVAFTPSLNIWKGRVSIQLMSQNLLNVPKPALDLDEASGPGLQAEKSEHRAMAARP